jgi:hypothetical protein
MKRIFFLCITLLLFRTSPGFGELTVLPPEEMLARAQIIVAGVALEIRPDREQPEFVLQVDTVYKGSLASPRLLLPLPELPDWDTDGRPAGTVPAEGSRLLLLLVTDEAGRLAPVADLNWAAFMAEGTATRLFFGASTKEWQEEQYIAAFNSYLTEAGTRRPADANREPEPGAEAEESPPGNALRALPFLLAGIFLLALALSRRIRKLPDSKGRAGPAIRK